MTPTKTIEKSYVKYNEKNKTLHIYFLPIEDSYDDELTNGIVIRRSLIDDRIIGVTILCLKDHSIKELKTFLPFVDPGIFNKYI